MLAKQNTFALVGIAVPVAVEVGAVPGLTQAILVGVNTPLSARGMP